MTDKGNMPNMSAEELSKAYSQYEGKSETDLMEELVALKRSGAIKDGQIGVMAQQIAPLLSDEQRRKLEAILVAFNEV